MYSPSVTGLSRPRMLIDPGTPSYPHISMISNHLDAGSHPRRLLCAWRAPLALGCDALRPPTLYAALHPDAVLLVESICSPPGSPTRPHSHVAPSADWVSLDDPKDAGAAHPSDRLLVVSHADDEVAVGLWVPPLALHWVNAPEFTIALCQEGPLLGAMRRHLSPSAHQWPAELAATLSHPAQDCALMFQDPVAVLVASAPQGAYMSGVSLRL